jgi:hypothetical protein
MIHRYILFISFILPNFKSTKRGGGGMYPLKSAKLKNKWLPNGGPYESLASVVWRYKAGPENSFNLQVTIYNLQVTIYKLQFTSQFINDSLWLYLCKMGTFE